MIPRKITRDDIDEYVQFLEEQEREPDSRAFLSGREFQEDLQEYTLGKLVSVVVPKEALFSGEGSDEWDASAFTVVAADPALHQPRFVQYGTA